MGDITRIMLYIARWPRLRIDSYNRSVLAGTSHLSTILKSSHLLIIVKGNGHQSNCLIWIKRRKGFTVSGREHRNIWLEAQRTNKFCPSFPFSSIFLVWLPTSLIPYSPLLSSLPISSLQWCQHAPHNHAARSYLQIPSLRRGGKPNSHFLCDSVCVCVTVCVRRRLMVISSHDPLCVECVTGWVSA